MIHESDRKDNRHDAFCADCRATAIGSFPFHEAGPALDAIFESLPEIPIWPQLPARSHREGFFAQYAAPIPGIRADWESGSLHLDTMEKGPAELERFYENVLGENLDAFALPSEHAEGFCAFLSRLAANGRPFAVKGHLTGPVSFGLGLADENRRAILYNETFFEAVRNAVRLQAAWQIEKLRPFADHAILFIDEPYLMNFGSAFSQFTKEQATGWIDEVADEVHRHGGLMGVHCCGNTDWSILFQSRVDVANFDAYEFFETIFLYPRELGAFLDRGGILAAGIVPTADDSSLLDAGALAQAVATKLRPLAEARGAEAIARQILITPACGLGTCRPEYAVEALRTTAEVSRRLRARFGFAC